MQNKHKNIEDFIGIFPEAFSTNFCDRAIELFNTAETMGMLVSRQQQGYKRTDKETDQLFMFPEYSISLTSIPSIFQEFIEVFWNSVYPKYIHKYGILESMDSHKVQTLKIQRTNPGEGYHVWHQETSNTNCKRVCNIAVYLNSVEEGGETEFLYYARRIKPTMGTAVIYPVGYTHTHRGNPPLSGTKYLLNGWLEY